MKTYIELSPSHFFGSKKSAKKAVNRLKKMGWPVHFVKHDPVWKFSSSDMYLTFVEDFKAMMKRLQPAPRWLVKTSIEMEANEICEQCNKFCTSQSETIEESWAMHYFDVDLELKQ